MKKIIIALSVLALATSCRNLSRDNPYDPLSQNFIGITYISEKWYPDSTTLSAMAFSGSYLYAAGYKQGTGACVFRLDGPSATVTHTAGAFGAFSGISGMCADQSGSVYICDDAHAVHKLDSGGSFSGFAVTNMTDYGGLDIEWSGGSLYMSNSADKKIYRYSDAGVPAVPDSKLLSCTANGYFTPGKIFSIGTYIYVVNKDRKDEVVRLAQDLSDAGTYTFLRDVADCAVAVTGGKLLSGTAVFNVDYGLASALKWGDYGEGPGRIINGKMIEYDAAGRFIYILDGGTIKVFGD
jgi:hypothetical protein